MKLPQQFLQSQFFMFSSLDELTSALKGNIEPNEIKMAQDLVNKGLPPITSQLTLATMFGVNPGLIWSFVRRPSRHYRTFHIPKGKGLRRIDAPRVALKIIQKWISSQLQQIYVPHDHVYGFVNGRSHVMAAEKHTNAHWVFSADIKDFFPSTPLELVRLNLQSIGFTPDGAKLISDLTCLHSGLAQGAPSSPVLSNICFRHVDEKLLEISVKYNVRLTRYADDIVFSGMDDFPEQLLDDVLNLFKNEPWDLSDKKTTVDKLPHRLKVHGMLVHNEHIRLTKGYRNKLRAYKHLLVTKNIRDEDLSKIRGHLLYGEFVDRFKPVKSS